MSSNSSPTSNNIESQNSSSKKTKSSFENPQAEYFNTVQNSQNTNSSTNSSKTSSSTSGFTSNSSSLPSISSKSPKTQQDIIKLLNQYSGKELAYGYFDSYMKSEMRKYEEEKEKMRDFMNKVRIISNHQAQRAEELYKKIEKAENHKRAQYASKFEKIESRMLKLKKEEDAAVMKKILPYDCK